MTGKIPQGRVLVRPSPPRQPSGLIISLASQTSHAGTVVQSGIEGISEGSEVIWDMGIKSPRIKVDDNEYLSLGKEDILMYKSISN